MWWFGCYRLLWADQNMRSCIEFVRFRSDWMTRPSAATFWTLYRWQIWSWSRPSIPRSNRCTTRSSIWRWSLCLWILMNRAQWRGTGPSKWRAKWCIADAVQDLSTHFTLISRWMNADQSGEVEYFKAVWWLCHFGPRNPSRRKP